MPFIGNQPALSYTSFAKQDFTTSATTSYTLDHKVANENELALFINFVRQEAGTAYTASNNTLTLSSATSSSDDMYAIFLGKAIQTVNPPNASVGASQIVDASITSGKLASGVLPTNTPAFEAYLSSDQSLSDGVTAKVQFNTEIFDSNNNYDNSTNYRFTPTTAGKYYVSSGLKIEAGSDVIKNGTIFIYKNGSSYKRSVFFTSTHQPDALSVYADAIIDMNGSSDYLEIFIYVDVSSGTPRCDADTKACHFKAFKIIE